MIIDKEELRKQLKKDDIKPVYLLFGEETFLRDLAAETIFKKACGEEQTDKHIFDLAKDSIEEAITVAKTLPLPFNRKTLVKITGVRISSTKENINEKDEVILKSYLQNPSQESIVVFVADEFNQSQKIAKMFIENAVVVEFKYLQGAQLRDQIQKKLNSLRVRAKPRAIDLLIQRTGNSLREIYLECEKLALAVYGNEKNLITYELVEQLVPDRLVPDNFALANYLLERNREKALETLRKLLREGVEPTMLLGLIASSFRRLFLTKEMMKKGVDRSEILKTARIPFNFQEEFFRIARRSDVEWLRKTLIKISEIDFAVKSSIATPQLQLEVLIIELTEE